MKLFSRISLLWKDTGTGSSGGIDASEARIRAWILGLAMLFIPPLLLLLYYKTMFPGLTNADALDYAQLGRNLSSGRGFVTDILRPLALDQHNNNPLQQPDVTHGPLYPFILALAFGILGAKDSVAAGVSCIFYLLTIPVVYMLGVRVFNRGVGLLTAAVFTFNSLLLEYAASALPITLYIFLTTCLMLVLFNMAQQVRARANDPAAKVSTSNYVLAGLLTGLLYLTDPIFFWIVPVIALVIWGLRPAGSVKPYMAFLVPMCLLLLWWMVRNAAVTGDPVFGLRGMEVWMDTKGHYPGYTAYRAFHSDLMPGVSLFKAVVDKMLLGLGTIIQSFPQVSASWILAFFLPCLLFRFTDPATNKLRSVMVYCLLGLVAGSLVFKIQMPLFVSVIPTMLIFSIAYLLHLIQQAQLRRGSMVLLTTLMTLAVCFPLASDMFLSDKNPGLREAGSARELKKTTRPNEVSISDQPWIVAWYADRPSVWIPLADTKINAIRQQFPTTRLFLTDQVRTFSPAWQYVYDVFQRWNLGYTQAIANNKPVETITINGNGAPLFTALTGFSSVPPVTGETPTVVVAAVPTDPPKIGMRPDANGTLGQ